ncbi:hypothetical protein [Mycolicibacterium vaccae]|uniref:hypothetical protein n=1 Tax=Mycolicibacterium vaccae TaxID=1810 RepID=UPI003D092ABC
MTTPDPRSFDSSFDEAPEADVVEQNTAIGEGDGDDATGWEDAERVADRRDDASEADLIDQSIAVPVEDADFDR